MDDQQKDQKVFRQNLDEKGSFQTLFQIYLLFTEKGTRPDGKKICKAKTIRVPESIPKRGIRQYVAHEAEELERQFKTGYGEDGNLPFQEYAERWLARQVRYAPGTLESYRRMLERVYPFIGNI